jgi:hypothetical protein
MLIKYNQKTLKKYNKNKRKIGGPEILIRVTGEIFSEGLKLLLQSKKKKD